MQVHMLRVEALVHGDQAKRLADLDRVSGLLVAIAEAVGAGQSSYDPSAVELDGGVTAFCVFPGGRVTAHTYAPRGRLPARYRVDVESCEPIDASMVLMLTERRLVLPADYRASAMTKGCRV